MTEPEERPDDSRQVAEYDQRADEATREVHSRDERGTIISIADLVGARVETDDGTARGTVTDVLVAPPPDLRVVGLVVGAGGWLHRLRIAPLVRDVTKHRQAIDEIPWEAVDHWDGLKVVLRPGADQEGVREEE